jgi:hypothetical protein
MPVAKIHVLEGQYDEARLGKVSKAVQDGLMSALGVPPDDFFQIIHILPRSQFRHTPFGPQIFGRPDCIGGHVYFRPSQGEAAGIVEGVE